MATPFLKMHGIGNDFVVLDTRVSGRVVSAEAARAIGDRRRGIGFDQLLVMAKPREGGDVRMIIFNPDGTEAESCGNGTRCVARLVLDETGKDRVVIETLGGRLIARDAGGGLVTVDMGAPGLEWEQIPLSERMDTRRIDVQIGPIDKPYLWGPAAVSMGNPHAVFFVDDTATIQLDRVGPLIENHPIFPERANVSFAEVTDPTHVKLRVWERSAGATLACGTAACATLVAGVRLNKLERKADIALPGGTLTIEWREGDNHVLMTGPAEQSYAGELGDHLEAVLTHAAAA
ncbi:Diaminopimelate epimerase [Alphaproteobacteria bacterium SO-S41]|nr:Diaminopimelate epimerase [Alphaproteobacteria bacterium SO-S41]